MHSNPPQQHEPSLKLADALERLAGALEQQADTLLDLKSDVGGLAVTLKEIEARLAALEDKQSAAPDAIAPQAKPKKRPK